MVRTTWNWFSVVPILNFLLLRYSLHRCLCLSEEVSSVSDLSLDVILQIHHMTNWLHWGQTSSAQYLIGWSERMIHDDRQMVRPITWQLFCECACSVSNNFLAAYLQIVLCNKPSGLCKTRRIDFAEWRAFLWLNVLVYLCFKFNRSTVRGGWRWTPTVRPGRWPLTSQATPPLRPRDCPLPEAQVHRNQQYCLMWIQV